MVIFMCQRKLYNPHPVKIEMDSSLPKLSVKHIYHKKRAVSSKQTKEPWRMFLWIAPHFGDSLFVHFQRQESFVIVSQVCLRSLHSGYSHFSPTVVSNSVFASSKPSQPILHEYVVKQNCFLLCCLFFQSYNRFIYLIYLVYLENLMTLTE